jgi:hypothetical protein
VARVGLFLEQHRERLFALDAHLERLASHTPRDPRYFDTSREPGRLVHPWNLIVPGAGAGSEQGGGGLMLTRDPLQRAAADTGFPVDSLERSV